MDLEYTALDVHEFDSVVFREHLSVGCPEHSAVNAYEGSSQVVAICGILEFVILI